MKFTVLTLFPEMMKTIFNESIIGRAVKNGILEINVVNIRDYTTDKHRRVDDSPYGGGVGMILRCQPVLDALEAVRTPLSHVAILAPIGKPYVQADAHRLAAMEELVLICGHYEGMDARIYPYADEILSIGDYVLTGGELPAMVICDSLMRLVEGSMKKESTVEESFEEGLLEYPQYTRPADYKGQKVPEILLSGDHEAIRKWRQEEALRVTKERRPDLLK